MLPLLSQATWAQKTTEEFLINLSRCDESCSRIALLQWILFCVEELSDIGSDHRDRSDNWCKDCLREVLTSSAVKSASSGTALYLIEGIFENDSEDIIDAVKESNICTNLEEYDKRNLMWKFTQILRLSGTADHTFLLPLLHSDIEKHNTNGIINFNNPHCPCRLLHVILLMVEKLRDFDYEDTACHGVWCTRCVTTVLHSTVLESVSRKTAFYLIKGIIQHCLGDCMRDVKQSNVSTKLEEFDILNAVRQFLHLGSYTKRGDHDFLFPLLTQATWTQTTNEQLLNFTFWKQTYMYGRLYKDCFCNFIQGILLLVDELGDIRKDNIYSCDKWCKECVMAILKSSAVISASRGTALYLIQGIIRNDLISVRVIASQVFGKVNVSEIFCIIKDFRKYTLYKWFIEHLSLSEEEVLYCIQHIINDEKTQSVFKHNMNPSYATIDGYRTMRNVNISHVLGPSSLAINEGTDNSEQDPILAILTSKRTEIGSFQVFKDVVQSILTQNSDHSYRRVLCALSSPNAALLTNDALGELLVDALIQRKKLVDVDGTGNLPYELKKFLYAAFACKVDTNGI